jgi:hypothetical protein
MPDYELGEVIPARTLTFDSDLAGRHTVTVSLVKPQADGRDVCSTYEIKGAGQERVMRIYGVDGFQAITLAMDAIRIEVEILDKHLGGKLQWEGGSVADFGNPPSKNSE